MLNKGLFPWVTDGEVSLLDKEEQGKGENIQKSEDIQIGQMGPSGRERAAQNEAGKADPAEPSVPGLSPPRLDQVGDESITHGKSHLTYGV